MMRPLLSCALAALAACTPKPPPPPPGPSVLARGDGTVAVSPDGREITLQRRGETLVRFPADAFQLGTVLTRDPSYAADPYWLERTDAPLAVPPPADLGWEHVERATVTSETDQISITLGFTGGLEGTVELRADAEGRFLLELRPTSIPAGVHVLWLRVRARVSPTEAFYGLGGFMDDVNHRGKLRPVQMEADLGIESANNELHVPVPFLVGTTGWGLFAQSRRMGAIGVADKEDDLVEITFATSDDGLEVLPLHLFWAEHPLDVTRHLYAVTGAPAIPAPWALGPWIWRDENRDQAQFLDDARMIRTLDLATSAMWIDRPYATAVNTFDFKSTQFPSPPAMIDEAHALGFRLSLWHTPYLEAAAQPLLGEARDAGHFPPDPGTLLNGWGEPIDFTNPAAYAFWQANIRRYTDLGIEGFKLDYAEDVLSNLFGSRNPWGFSDGSDERTMHHDYTVLYHRVYAEMLPDDGYFLLGRAGRWGDQVNVSVIWPGDLDATFTKHREVFTPRGESEPVTGVGGLPASVVMGLNLGVIGFPFFGADSGGYRHSPPDNELFIRWIQQTALSSVMQVGDSSSEVPWEFTTENGRSMATVDIYRRYARLHLRLLPYEWTLAQQIATTGHPIQRPVGLQFPGLGEHPVDEYLFGDDLLVAPVMERGAVSRSVLFPPGRWMDWWTGAFVDGGTRREVAAPLEVLPLFAREGSIIPMLRDTIDTASPATEAGIESSADDPGVLTVRVVSSTGRTSFRVFDGTEIAQEGGTITITAGTRFTQGTALEVFGRSAPAEVRVDGNVVQGWTFGDGVLRAMVPAGNHSVTF